MDCYAERAALIKAEANAENDVVWEPICDRRLEVDDDVLDAPATTEEHFVAKLEILLRRAQWMTIENLLPMARATFAKGGPKRTCRRRYYHKAAGADRENPAALLRHRWRDG